MSTVAVAVSRPLGGRLVAFLTALVEGIREGRAMARRYDRYSRMSRTEMARHGFDRDTLSLAVVHGL